MTSNENRINALDCRSWERVLCVVAHPDDTEYGISAAVNARTKSGIDVSYLLLTSGEAGMKRDPEEVGPLRAKEQRAACDAVGAGGRAAIDAARDAGNRWVFRELAEEEGLEPWEPDVFLVGQVSDPTHVVAVDDEDVAASVASLECHREYLADLPDHPKPADFIPPMLAEAGALIGERNGVAFRVYELGGVAKSRD